MDKELREYFDNLNEDIEKIGERVSKLEEEKELRFLKRRKK